jgi:hypothetical protein
MVAIIRPSWPFNTFCVRLAAAAASSRYFIRHSQAQWPFFLQ